MSAFSILLVEDNPADADLTREAFEINQQEVDLSVVLDGVDAIDFLHKRERFKDVAEPDLVLLDLNLPRKGGREVLAEMKTSDSLRRIPVVILSSSEDERDILQSYELGANCYISKPVDFEGFVDTMRCLNGFWFYTAKLPGNADR